MESMPLLTVEFTGERDIGRLPTGHFTQTLVGNRVRAERLAGPIGRQLRPVRHRQQHDRNEHAAALDVPPCRRPIRCLQPQRAVDRSIAGSLIRISCSSSFNTRFVISVASCT